MIPALNTVYCCIKTTSGYHVEPIDARLQFGPVHGRKKDEKGKPPGRVLHPCLVPGGLRVTKEMIVCQSVGLASFMQR